MCVPQALRPFCTTDIAGIASFVQVQARSHRASKATGPQTHLESSEVVHEKMRVVKVKLLPHTCRLNWLTLRTGI